jgi:hypothetical protein
MKKLISVEGILVLALAVVPSAAQNTIKGSGRTNNIALWTSSSTIGSSVLSQSSGNLTTSGRISAASFAGDGSLLSNVNAARLGGLLPSAFAQLGAASNAFSGSLSGSTINSNGDYHIGGIPIMGIGGDPSLQNLYIGQGEAQLANGGVTGNFNTAVGNFALYHNTGGVENTAFGGGALGSNQTGVADVAVGKQALFAKVIGNANTAVGHEALYNLYTGSNNVAIGAGAGSNYNGGETSNVLINSPGLNGEFGAIRIGVDGSQGISVCPSSNCQIAAYIAAVRNVTTGQGDAVAVLIDSKGQLGTVSSSRRYKEDIQDMGVSSDGLLRLRPVTFRYRKPYADGSKPIQYGLVAEEVAKVYPDLVVRGKDGQMETVQYYKLDAMLLNEVQKLAKAHATDQAEISALRSQIAEQQKRAQKQDAVMLQLQAEVGVIQIALASDRSAHVNKLLAATTGGEK